MSVHDPYPDKAPDPDFERHLPHLVSRYQAGRLIPFIGSGMSRLVCTDWNTFVTRLEKAAGLTSSEAQSDPAVTVRRAYAAVRALKLSEPGRFDSEVRKALVEAGEHPPELPASMQALGRLWWPLVLTTNYDTCFEYAFLHAPRSGDASKEEERLLAVVGRSPEACQRVLTSLYTAGRTLLWALQGYLGDTPAFPFSAKRERVAELSQELVVGHEEYRRVAYRDLHFRRAFAEVFRHRSLLFLGAGLQEPYLQDLFSEVLEAYGPSIRLHYAFQLRGQVDVKFLRERFQIIVIEYDRHDCVRARLDNLRTATDQPAWRSLRFCYGGGTRRVAGETEGTSPGLEVVSGSLPIHLGPGECLAVSAGGTGKNFVFSEPIQALLRESGVGDPRPEFLRENLGLIAPNIFAVRARSEQDDRSLATIYSACEQFFGTDARKPFKKIHMQLISAGSPQQRPGWEGRIYPSRFSLVQMIRAWGDHTRAALASKAPEGATLTVYVRDRHVYHELASGRIDLQELLICPDLRFFCEIVRDKSELERRWLQGDKSTTMREVMADLRLETRHWCFRISPMPSLDELSYATNDGRVDLTLHQLGVVPGSTLHFFRPDNSASDLDGG